MTVDLSKGTVQLRRTKDQGESVTPVEDDFKRELSFYQQALQAASEFRAKILQLGQVFSKPSEYFADMFKNVSHMSKIAKRQEEREAASKKSALAKQQRLNKKYGKQIQVAKQQQRHEQKRRAIDQIESFKKKRKNSLKSSVGSDDEERASGARRGRRNTTTRGQVEREFDVAVEIDQQQPRRSMNSRGKRPATKSTAGKRNLKNRPGKKTRQLKHSQKLKSFMK